MPLTPLHLGSGLFLGALTTRFNLWAILLGTVVADLEPLTLILVQNCYYCPHHSFFHSILGAIVGSLVLAVILWSLRKNLNEISLKFKSSQPFSFPVLFFSSLTGWLSHISFDSLTHYDVFPFWPLKYNPILLGPQVYWPLNFILFAVGIIGSLLLIKHWRSARSIKNP